jgi:hypothetical protein
LIEALENKVKEAEVKRAEFRGIEAITGMPPSDYTAIEVGQLWKEFMMEQDVIASDDLEILKTLREVARGIEDGESRVGKESAENRKYLLTLLGLQPDSTSQEIIEAIDDIAPVFVNYRKNKRGT